jgi:hypothetical protein
MRSKITLFLLVLVLFSSTVPASAGDDFANSIIGREIIKIGLRFLDNPGDFFFNLHSDNEDYSPVPKNKKGSFRFNFIPTFMPFTWANLNVKAKVFDEKNNLPQIDITGMYGYIIGLKLISTETKPEFSDYSIGITAAKSINEKTRLYGGIKYSTVNMYVKFSTPVTSGEFSMSSLDFKMSDTFVFTGISHQPNPDKIVVAQLGYGFKYNKIISRLMVSHKHLDIGINIYPEGLFVIHPFIAWHWYF